MQPADRARRELLTAARRVLELTQGTGTGPLTVVVLCGRMAVVSDESPTSAPAPVLPAGLTSLQRMIATVLGPTPRNAKEIARLCGQRYSSRLRTALADLVELRVARRTRHGYTLDRP